MSKYPAPLPHDVAAEDIEFRKAFASAMIKGNQVSPPAQKPAPELGGSASGLVEITSRLWKESFCLSFGVRDDFGGVLLPLNQSWFGHLAPKPTALYIVGCAVPDLAQHYSDELAVGRIENMSTAQRETTPLPFARFLVDLVNTCKAVS